MKQHYWYKKKKIPLRPGKNYISACSARHTAASRDSEQRKHWASASPQLRAVQNNKAGGSRLLSNAVDKDPVVSLIHFWIHFIVAVVNLAQLTRPLSNWGLARMCDSISQLGSMVQKKRRREEQREPRKPEISSSAEHLRFVEKVDVLGAVGWKPAAFLSLSFWKRLTEYDDMGAAGMGVRREAEPDCTSRIWKHSQQVWGWRLRRRSAGGSVSSIAIEGPSQTNTKWNLWQQWLSTKGEAASCDCPGWASQVEDHARCQMGVCVFFLCGRSILGFNLFFFFCSKTFSNRRDVSSTGCT